MYGRYSGDFLARAETRYPVILSPTAIGLLVDGYTSTGEVEGFVVVASEGAPLVGADASSRALVTRNVTGSLLVRNCALEADNGAIGADAVSGADGVDGGNGLPGGSSCVIGGSCPTGSTRGGAGGATSCGANGGRGADGGVGSPGSGGVRTETTAARALVARQAEARRRRAEGCSNRLVGRGLRRSRGDGGPGRIRRRNTLTSWPIRIALVGCGLPPMSRPGRRRRRRRRQRPPRDGLRSSGGAGGGGSGAGGCGGSGGGGGGGGGGSFGVFAVASGGLTLEVLHQDLDGGSAALAPQVAPAARVVLVAVAARSRRSTEARRVAQVAPAVLVGWAPAALAACLRASASTTPTRLLGRHQLRCRWRGRRWFRSGPPRFAGPPWIRGGRWS